jgi:hypothetical protein
MSKIWDLLVVGYFIVMGLSILMILLKLLIPHLIFSIDEVCDNKRELCNCVINYIENEMGVTIQNLTINFDYLPNDEYRGYYQQNTHSVTLYHENLGNVYSWILTLIEEIHHSIFVSTKSGIKIYELYDRKVGYENNPLEYAAKLYAVKNFRSIHRKLKKQGLISYKV